MSVINQKEYLKKYLSLGSDKHKSKKKKKKSKILKDRLKIIDDDIDIPCNINENELNEFLTAEDAPQVCGIIDDRPLALRLDDYRKSDKWKLVGSDDELKEPEKKSENDVMKKNKYADCDAPSSSNNAEVASKSRYNSKQSDSDASPPRRNRNKSDSDASPPRRNRNKSDSDASPPRRNRNKSDSDLTPPRNSKNYDSDISPPRKTKRYDSDVSPPRRGRKKSDISPPRRGRQLDSNPPRKTRRKSDSDVSPPRRNRNNSDSDASPPRKPNKSKSDVSPPRRNRKSRFSDVSPPGNVRKFDNSPPREADLAKPPRKSRFSDASPPRKSRFSDASPPRKSRFSDASPPRKSRFSNASPPRMFRNPASDESPPIKQSKHTDKSRKEHQKRDKYLQDTHSTRHESLSSRDRTAKNDDRADKSGKMSKTLDGKTAGLQSGADLKKESAVLRKKEDDLFKNMSAEISGKDAAPILRDRKTGKKRDLEKEAMDEYEKQQKENVQKEKYAKWGKGLKQVDEHKEKMEQDLYEMSKPLARYADDQDLEKYLREQEREGDPMLKYIRKKKRKEIEASGVPLKPLYEGEFMPNRFGIPPGHRWDGVNRSNGYETQWFTVQNSKKAVEEEVYKWSTEDM